jgi:hypothetical protein
VPGAHTPAHAPSTQAWPAHGVALPHAPIELHVCTPLPEHCVELGRHTPTQPPAMHAWLPQSAAAPHWPVAKHVCTPLPAHTVAPAAHAKPPSALPPSSPTGAS